MGLRSLGRVLARMGPSAGEVELDDLASDRKVRHDESADEKQTLVERETKDVLKTTAWVSVAMVYGIGVYVVDGRRRALEYFTGYIIEQSLSIDNLFVFLLIFNYFQVPRESQEPVLFWGILGAMVLRGLMIVAGSALVRRFAVVYVVFASFLLYSAIKLFFEGSGDDDEGNLDNNRVVRLVRRILPVADRFHGQKFIVRDPSGRLLATPLLLVLCCVELSDIVFAMDSVPAVLGISNDTFVIYSSNIMAVLGLRSLFFVVSDAIASICYLKQSLALVLGFVGLKMFAGVIGYEIGIATSLVVVVVVLTGGVIISLLRPATRGANDSGPSGV